MNDRIPKMKKIGFHVSIDKTPMIENIKILKYTIIFDLVLGVISPSKYILSPSSLIIPVNKRSTKDGCAEMV